MLFPITSTKQEWKMDVYIHIIFGNLKRKKYSVYNDIARHFILHVNENNFLQTIQTISLSYISLSFVS